MTWNFSGANFDRSAIGPKAHVDNRHSSGGLPVLAELRNHLASARSDFEAAERSPEQRALLGEALDRLEEAVGSDTVDSEIVHRRWERVRGMLGPSLQVAANAAQITSLVLQLTQGT